MVASGEQSKTFLAHELSRIYHRKCEEISNEEEKSLCKAKCGNASQIPKPHSQMSEKLIDTANNLSFERAQLSSMADEIDAYNSMSI